MFNCDSSPKKTRRPEATQYFQPLPMYWVIKGDLRNSAVKEESHDYQAFRVSWAVLPALAIGGGPELVNKIHAEISELSRISEEITELDATWSNPHG
jgi:hypothetical protein